MTEAQQQMIDKAFEILTEHFDHVVIAVGTYDEDKQYTTTASYYGGVDRPSGSASSTKPAGPKSTSGAQTTTWSKAG